MLVNVLRSNLKQQAGSTGTLILCNPQKVTYNMFWHDCVCCLSEWTLIRRIPLEWLVLNYWS